MNFIKRNLILISIITTGIILRLNNSLWVDGYNFDELAMVSISKSKTLLDLFKNCANLDYHAPLYYLIIKPFLSLNNEWLYIRSLNLIFSIINILFFYKIGKLIKNKSLGLILAILLAINHLYITTGAFVKFYCFNFLIFSICLYYLIKIVKNNKNYLKFNIYNSILILSSTLGFLIYSIELLFIFLKTKKIYKSTALPILSFLFYLPILIIQTNNALASTIKPHENHYHANIKGLYALVNDYVTPLINYCCNIETLPSLGIYESLKENFDINVFIFFLFISLIPTVISVMAYIFSFKNKILKTINLIAITYLLLFFILSKAQIVGFVPIYLFSFGLILLINLGYFIEKQKKPIKSILISYFILINLIIPITYPQEKQSCEFFKTYLAIEKYFKENAINKDTKIIMTDGARFLKLYYDDKNISAFDDEEITGKFNNKFEQIYKNNDFESCFNKEISNSKNIIFIFNCEINNLIIKDGQIPADKKDFLLNKRYKELITLIDKNYSIISFEKYQYNLKNNYIKTKEEKYPKLTTLNIAQDETDGWIFITYEKRK